MTGVPALGFLAIARGSALVFSCRVTGAAFTLLLQIILARWMGATELGVYVLAFSWCILLATASHLGLAPAALRVVGQGLGSGNPGLIWGFLKRAGQIVSATSILVAVIGAAAVVLLGEYLPGGNITPYLLALTLVPLFAYINVRCVVAVAFRWIYLAFFWTEVIRPISICIIVAAIWFLTAELTASTVVIVQIAVLTGVALVLYSTLRRRLRQEVAPAQPEFETRLWLRTALPLLVISFFNNYFPEFLLILVGSQASTDQVAIFNASYRLALVVTFALTAIDAITSPVAAKLYAEQKFEDLQTVVTRATKLGFLSSLVAVATFAIIGHKLLGLFGPEFVAGYQTMMILLTAQLVRSAAGPVMSLLSVTGHQDRCLAVFGSALIGSVILVVMLVPIFGLRGAAASVLLITLGWSIWLHRLVVLHLHVRPSIFRAFART